MSEARRQAEVVERLFREIPEEALSWRPSERRWSVTGHVAHVNITNEAYLEAMRRAIEAARARGGPTGKGPFEHPRIATWFVAQLEPPPKRRVKTFRSMVPDPAIEPAVAAARFRTLQEGLEERIGEARALDLGRVRFGSPFFAPLRLSLGAGLGLLLAHNRRHLWLIDEVLSDESFPGRRPKG